MQQKIVLSPLRKEIVFVTKRIGINRELPTESLMQQLKPVVLDLCKFEGRGTSVTNLLNTLGASEFHCDVPH